MKHFTVTAAALTLAGCMETSLPIPLDDPRWARADERHAGSLYGASGIAGLAYIGVVMNPGFADVFYDPLYTNDAEIAAAPARICAHMNGTVTSAENKAHPSREFYPNARVLEVRCTT